MNLLAMSKHHVYRGTKSSRQGLQKYVWTTDCHSHWQMTRHLVIEPTPKPLLTQLQTACWKACSGPTIHRMQLNWSRDKRTKIKQNWRLSTMFEFSLSLKNANLDNTNRYIGDNPHTPYRFSKVNHKVGARYEGLLSILPDIRLCLTRHRRMLAP